MRRATYFFSHPSAHFLAGKIPTARSQRKFVLKPFTAKSRLQNHARQTQK